MKMRRSLGILAVLTLCGALGLHAEEGAAPAEAAKGWPVLQNLPSETLVAVSIRDTNQAFERLKQTGLWAIANDAGVQQAFKMPLLQMQVGLAAFQQQAGFSLNDLLTSFQGEVTLGYLGSLQARGEDGKPIPDFVFGFQPRGQLDAWLGRWNRVVDKLNALTQNTLAMNTGNFDGVEITTLSHPQAPFEIQYAVADGNWLVSLGQGRIENLLASRKAQGADLVKTLGTTPAFQRAVKKSGEGADALVYVNLEELKKIPDLNFDPANEQQAAQQKALGLPGIKGLAYSVRFEGKGLKELLYLDAPAAERTGLLTLLGGPPVPVDALGALPRSSLLAFTLQAEPLKILDRLIELAALVDPAAAERINQGLAQANQKLGIDVRQDLLGVLTGEATFAVSVPARNAKLPVGFPAPVLSLKVSDKEKAQATLGALRKAGLENVEYAELSHAGATLTVAREKIGREGGNPGMLCWAIKDDRLLLSIFPLALRDELDRLAAPDTAQTLAQDEAFKSAGAQVEPSQQALLYLDAGAIATAAYEILIPVAQLQGSRDRQVDLLALPSADVLSRNLTAQVTGVRADEDGLAVQSYSSTGMAPGFLPLAALIRRAERRPGGRAEAPVDPKAIEQRQLMRDLHQKLNAFARDNAGAFPETLQALAPKYLTDEEAGRLPDVVYLGKQAAENQVVAYLGPANGNRPVPVLLQSGSVKVVRAKLLQDVLQHGYKEGNEEPAPGESVKPAQPPQDF
ncbi:MAG: DUF3352 domain-containing protein [Planctomycetota bacterium]|nr:DUF3352 domain-containing protein [Planctomycetota bacterium]